MPDIDRVKMRGDEGRARNEEVIGPTIWLFTTEMVSWYPYTEDEGSVELATDESLQLSHVMKYENKFGIAAIQDGRTPSKSLELAVTLKSVNFAVLKVVDANTLLRGPEKVLLSKTMDTTAAVSGVQQTWLRVIHQSNDCFGEKHGRHATRG